MMLFVTAQIYKKKITSQHYETKTRKYSEIVYYFCLFAV